MSRRQRPQCNGNTPVTHRSRQRTFREDLATMGLEIKYHGHFTEDLVSAGPKLIYQYPCRHCGYVHHQWKDVSRSNGCWRKNQISRKPGRRFSHKGYGFSCTDTTACRRRRRKAEQVAACG